MTPVSEFRSPVPPESRSRMDVHFDVLGWLYVVCGAFAILTGFSLGVLASGTRAALDELTAVSSVPEPASPTVWLFILSALIFIAGGVLMMVVGRAVVGRARFGRPAALGLAVPTLLIVPFGTALGVYTFWVLLNDDARGEFNAPPIQSQDGTRS